MMKTILVIPLLWAGCADVRFADRAILWHDPDDAPIPMPKAREQSLYGPGVRDEVFLPAERALSLEIVPEAPNVNALDELPESSWWVDPRRDREDPAAPPRALSDEEMMNGACEDTPPPEPPFVVLRAKTEGATVGFIVKDARGRKLMLKGDPAGWPHLATSTEAVATRLVWAGGWRVPKVFLLELRREEVVWRPEATTKDAVGRQVPLSRAQFDAVMARANYDESGRFLAAASLWIEGKAIGSYGYSGRREDDANDRVLHQDRRDLRGLGLFSAWINNIDTHEIQTFDSYVGEPGQGHVVHYQQDVSGSFGSHAVGPIDYWMGSENYFATGKIFASLFSFGALRRPWEGERVETERARILARYPQLGYFDADHFDARCWKPTIHNLAFDRATARDKYWAVKRVLAFSERELRAAITVGKYPREAADRLFEVLWRRREKLGRAFLADVAALDHFRVERGQLCFEDIWIKYGFGGESKTEYQARGGILDGNCVILPQSNGYKIITLNVKRSGERKFGPSVRVHLIDRRIVGVER